MTSPNLIRRLRYLYTTERNFVYVFSALTIYTAIAYPIRSVVLLLYGLVLIAYLLFQGQRYWQVKLSRLLNQPIQEVAQLAFAAGMPTTGPASRMAYYAHHQNFTSSIGQRLCGIRIHQLLPLATDD
jgi:hypothetical protein